MTRATLWLPLLLAIGACDRSHPSLPTSEHIAPTTQVVYLPTQTVMLRGTTFVLEVARTTNEQETGLMYRTAMPADHGMIFPFPEARPQNFWMKNTLIPLDIAFLDADAVVLNVEQMYPLDLQGIRSAGDAKYAIELNQGAAGRIGLRAGDHVTLPADVR